MNYFTTATEIHLHLMIIMFVFQMINKKITIHKNKMIKMGFPSMFL